MKNFDPKSTLAEAKPEEILAWAISQLDRKLDEYKADNARRYTAMTDDELKSKVGKREQARILRGTLTVADARKKLIDRANEPDAKDHDRAVADLESAFSRYLPAAIRIDIEWKKSRTWGANPKAEVWADGYSDSEYVGGCGYDKESTATAHAFNKNPVFSRIAATCAWVDMKEAEATGKDTRTYGLYTSIGGFKFEGAVGFNCHRNIIERAGYRLVAEFHPKAADGYRFEKI